MNKRHGIKTGWLDHRAPQFRPAAGARMNIGNLLVAKGLMSTEDIDHAIHHHTKNGGRLGDSIVALGMLTREQIDEVLVDAPQAPAIIESTGVDSVFLVDLAIKGMYAENLETSSQLVASLKLPNTSGVFLQVK